MEEIPLGSLNSKIYKNNGELYFKISPIYGMQIGFYLNAPISGIEVLKSTESEIVLKKGILKLTMLFKPYMRGLHKLTLKPSYFRLPFGVYWCEISDKNKEKLNHVFQVKNK